MTPVIACDQFREEVSARFDGEPATLTDENLRSHVAECESCAEWEPRFVATARRLRVRPVVAPPDITDAVLTAMASRTDRVWRIALIALGALQIVLGLSQFFFAGWGHAGHDLGADWSSHLFDEGAAWNVAIGAGFVWAGRRSDRDGSLLAPFGVFSILITILVIRDLVLGVVPPSRVLSHLPLLIGTALLFGMSIRSSKVAPPGASLPLPEAKSGTTRRKAVNG